LIPASHPDLDDANGQPCARASIRLKILKRVRMVLFCAPLLFAQTGFCVQPLAQANLLKISDQPWVDVDIGRHHGVKCIVDVGSTEAGVLPTRYAQGSKYLRPAVVATANGVVKMPEVQIDGIAIGGSRQTAVRFLLRDQSWFHEGDPMPCVLGMEFLSRYTVDLDGSRGWLRLYPRGTRLEDVFGGSLPDGARLAASIHGGSPIEMDAMVDDIRVKATIDTGWGLVTPNQSLLDALGIRPGDPRIVSQSVRSVLSDRPMTLQIVELRQVRIGGLVVENVRASIGESGMRMMRREADPYLHIGWDLLRAHRFLLDMAHRDAALIP
jgi:predicted aspartyl protease